VTSDTCFKLEFGLLQDTSGPGQNRRQEPRVPTGFHVGTRRVGTESVAAGTDPAFSQKRKAKSRNAFARGLHVKAFLSVAYDWLSACKYVMGCERPLCGPVETQFSCGRWTYRVRTITRKAGRRTDASRTNSMAARTEPSRPIVDG
jgi:hypothetical protein